METIEVLKQLFASSYQWYGGTIADVTAEQANQVPPGRAHPIGELAAHIIQSEDGIVNMLRGQPALWERDGWGQRLGIPNVMLHDNDGARAFRCEPAKLAEYIQAVQAQTVAYLDALQPADLDREVPGPTGPMSVAEMLFATIGNTFAHTGEISALKGTLGARGYPF